MNKLSVIISDSVNPYENLALEKFLLENVLPGQVFLYLWQNEKTVVCGRNQNIWKECTVDALKNDGGFPARRLSGGGAVYHDLGNLNFTFLACGENYSLDMQLDVIKEAALSFGIDAQRSGRNDITAGGAKFSGNAFYKANPNRFEDRIIRRYHHGTLMVCVDKQVLSKYLSVDREKYESKGVDSVKSRVCNLCELNPDINVENMAAAMINAFEKVYSGRACIYLYEMHESFKKSFPLGSFAEGILNNKEKFPHAGKMPVKKYEKKYIENTALYFGSDEWLYKNNIKFNVRFFRRFDFGDLDLRLYVEKGKIKDTALYSDAMDEEWILSMYERLKQLKGQPYSLSAVKEAISDKELSDALLYKNA